MQLNEAIFKLKKKQNIFLLQLWLQFHINGMLA